jgi:hypothetical protein
MRVRHLLLSVADLVGRTDLATRGGRGVVGIGQLLLVL